MGLPLAIAIGAGFGGISALARGESNRNVLKSMLTGKFALNSLLHKIKFDFSNKLFSLGSF